MEEHYARTKAVIDETPPAPTERTLRTQNPPRQVSKRRTKQWTFLILRNKIIQPLANQLREQIDMGVLKKTSLGFETL